MFDMLYLVEFLNLISNRRQAKHIGHAILFNPAYVFREA